ncbi:hypothetical protein FRB96_005140 [Tulasnella sp. 330]|nr:hypothetical protein FRB96_005140 [Tulasnella sp. 330]
MPASLATLPDRRATSPPQYGQQQSTKSGAMSSASSLMSVPHLDLFESSEGMSRERSNGQSSSSTLLTPVDDYHHDLKQDACTDYFSNRKATSDATPEASKRHGVLLPGVHPSINGYGSPPRPVVVRTSLQDQGPVSTPPPASRGGRRNDRSPRTSPQPPRTQKQRHQDSPSTPVRRRTAKELINHFEQSASASKNPSEKKIGSYDRDTPARRTPLSNARLNEPLPALPALPLPESRFSGSPTRSSPIRSLMNLVGLRKKGKGGSRGKSISPSPMRRALLAEDDDADKNYPIYEIDPYDEEPVTMKTLAADHSTPTRDVPLFGSNAQVDNNAPAIYLAQSPTSSSSSASQWYNTHAILQAPTLTISLSNNSSSEPGPSTSPPFRQLNLRGATVESLPSMTIDLNTAARLQLGVSDPSGVTAYVFEVTMPIEGSSELKKEMFASTSPWEKGKWMQHIIERDAICAPIGTSGQAVSSSPDNASQVHCLPGDSDEEDPRTHRLQPPLRVVNVSKLSCFFDDTMKTSRKSYHTPMNRSGTGETGISLNRNFVSDHGPVEVVKASQCLVPPTAMCSNPLRSAPLARPEPYDSAPASHTQAPFKGRVKSLKRRSKSVPCSPSITNLGNLTLVQQRLAKFESVREGVGPVNDEERGRTLLDQPQRSLLRRTETQISRMTVGGLTTPPTSPQKASFALSRQGTTVAHSSAAFPGPPVYESTGMNNETTLNPSIYSVASPPASSLTPIWNTYEARPSVTNKLSSYHPGDIVPLSLSTRGQGDQAPQPELGLQHGIERQWSTATTQRHDDAATRRGPDSEYRLSAITSLPASEFPDIAPLFALVRDTAVEQAELAKVLAQRLDNLRGDVLDLRDEKQSISFNSTSGTGSGTADPASGAMDILEDIRSKLEEIAIVQPIIDIEQLRAEVSGLRKDDFPKHLQTLSAVRSKVDKLDEVQSVLATLNQSNTADRTVVTQKLDGLAGAVRAMDMTVVNQRLDSMRASLAVLEAVAQTNRPASAFRNNSGSSSGSGEVDLSGIHAKLDALTSAQEAGASGDPVVTEKLDALVIMLKDTLAKTTVSDASDQGGTDNVKSGSDIQTLLTHLKEDQVNREKYYKDLNSWLQSNASQTGSQYHNLVTQLQQLTQSLAPAAPPSDNQQDPASPGAAPTTNNIFEDIKQALVENNSRNRTNDNFLAAANHLIGAANTERQKLVALISSQREENEKLLSSFANQITQEIRGHKHSFVDAMEKATALNVEGQLRELKNQMSNQLAEMAQGAEQLLDERKALEHQIAELLTFKDRFSDTLGVRDHGPVSYVNQSQAQPPSHRSIQPPPQESRRERPRPQAQSIRLPQPGRYPDPSHTSYVPLPPPSDRPSRPLPTPGIPRSGHLHVPHPGQRF